MLGQLTQTWLPQEHHDGRHQDESHEVAGCLFVSRGYSSVLFQFEPESLHQVSIFVPVSVVHALHLAVFPGRDHGLGALGLDRFNDGSTIVSLVADHDLYGDVFNQSRRLGYISLLARCQDQLHRQAQSADSAVDFGAESASAAAQSLFLLAAGPIRFFFAPAAQGCARITVESSTSHSRSVTCNASNTRFQVPLRDQRSNRFQTEFQLPKRSGRSRHGTPVLAIQRTPSMNRRLSSA